MLCLLYIPTSRRRRSHRQHRKSLPNCRQAPRWRKSRLLGQRVRQLRTSSPWQRWQQTPRTSSSARWWVIWDCPHVHLRAHNAPHRIAALGMIIACREIAKFIGIEPECSDLRRDAPCSAGSSLQIMGPDHAECAGRFCCRNPGLGAGTAKSAAPRAAPDRLGLWPHQTLLLSSY